MKVLEWFENFGKVEPPLLDRHITWIKSKKRPGDTGPA